jgi:hypothetical protein
MSPVITAFLALACLTMYHLEASAVVDASAHQKAMGTSIGDIGSKSPSRSRSNSAPTPSRAASPAASPVASPTPSLGSGVQAVNLGSAENFAILSLTGVTNIPTSAVTGNVGASPITGAAILISCTEVSGTIYSVDAAGPSPCAIINPSFLRTAVGDMMIAYGDASGRSNGLVINLGAGLLSGLTLSSGTYRWSTAVKITGDITLQGTSTDVFIFQVAGTLKTASGVNIILSGGVQAKNVFWVTTGAVTIGTTSHFEGTVLGATSISLLTGASIKGRLLAQTAVNLQMNVVTLP